MATTLKQLQIIEYGLTTRDKEILKAIQSTKCLFTYHIRRLFFYDAANTQSAARATNRCLKRLRDQGLIDSLVNRRIGGVRAGSASYIWHLTEQGNRLLDLDNKYKEKKPKRTRFFEPADTTLNHRMAIAECWVQLMEASRSDEMRNQSVDYKVREVAFEPTNWKYFQYRGKQEILKPDLSVVVSHHQYEYRFFLEIDLGTESLDTIIGKCIRYYKYLQSGIEQQENGVFPVVLWIVKGETRKQKIESEIRHLCKNQARIFMVLVADEFKEIITARQIPEDRLC